LSADHKMITVISSISSPTHIPTILYNIRSGDSKLTSGQNNLTQGRIAAAYGWLSRIRQAASTCTPYITRRPASADRTARRQYQATGQPVSRTQASDAMTSRMPRYEAKCVQRRCFQWGSVLLRSDIKGTELPPTNILIPLERQLIALQLCR